MAGNGSTGAGCGGIIMLAVVALGGWWLYVAALEPMIFPSQAAHRAEEIAASNAAEAAKKLADEQRVVRYRASLVENERAKVAAAQQREVDAEAERQHAAANAAASERATTAALERYADCTVRNRTPNGCYEDWRPTPEARAMVERMR